MMENSDRRSGEDRRAHKRQRVSIDVEWESGEGRKFGTMSDLSVAGCFVLCSGEVNDGDSVKVFLPLGDGTTVELIGEVRNHVPEIGFALGFTEMTDAQTDMITGLMANYGKYSPS